MRLKKETGQGVKAPKPATPSGWTYKPRRRLKPRGKTRHELLESVIDMLPEPFASAFLEVEFDFGPDDRTETILSGDGRYELVWVDPEGEGRPLREGHARLVRRYRSRRHCCCCRH